MKLLTDAWEVLVLFLIPIGGGIPAGVLLAKGRDILWPVMMALYFISDVILALFLEPFLRLIIFIGHRVPVIDRFAKAFREVTKRSVERYGYNTGPLALIMISFGVDPMTGRAAAAASGHGFMTGWLIAIAGDMIYFTLIMVCTLWLSDILGDGTWATMIILALTIGVPIIWRHIREPRR